MPAPAPVFEAHSVITAICPECQDAVVALPGEQRGMGYDTEVQGLKCSRCGYFIVLPVSWVLRRLYVAGR